MIIDIKDTSSGEYISRVRELLGERTRYCYVYTFGCQQNEADSERIRGLALEMGYLPTDNFECAELIILNTCAIRELAEMKALSMLGRFKAYKESRPEVIIGVCGCMAAEENMTETIKKSFRQVSFTLEPALIHRVPEMVYRTLSEQRRSFVLGDGSTDIVEGLPAVRSSRHKAWVSVMYGCNNFCSYCIVPYTRGRERSRSSADIIAECKALVAEGTKEITLLGQNVNSYRSDMNFAELISAIAEIPGDFIIRFMTSHPKDTSDELIAAMKKYTPKIAPFFHLPLQSGSDSVLRAMNRTYTSDKYLETVRKLREAVPGIALSTDIIVGFPGESEEDFALTMKILEAVRFDMVYAFIYSPREGTRAAKMDNQIPKDVKSERISRLLKMQDDISIALNEEYIGRELSVLCDEIEEREGEALAKGRCETNKLVTFTAENPVIGKIYKIKIERCGPYILWGTEVR